jgi:hypothetical protein
MTPFSARKLADAYRWLISCDVFHDEVATSDNEVKVKVLNTPDARFPRLDMPQHANENGHNAHSQQPQTDAHFSLSSRRRAVL